MAGPVILILIGALVLLGNTKVIPWSELRHYFALYWPVLLILWGLVRLGEYFWARQSERQTSRLSSGGVFLIVLIVLAGLSIHETENMDWGSLQRDRVLPEIDLGNGDVLGDVFGQAFDFSQEIQQSISADATLGVNSDRGSVTVTSSDENRIRVVVHKRVRAENQQAAAAADAATQVQLSQTGSEISLNANTRGDSKASVQSDLEIFVPAKTALKISARGDIAVRGRKATVNISSSRGDIALEDINGNATISLRRGDLTATRLTGDLAIEGVAGEITVSDVNGSVTLNGGAQDAVKLTRIARDVNYRSSRTTLHLARVDGELRLDQGDLTGNGISGPVQVTTRSKDVRLENVSGNIDLQNANGNIGLRVGRLPVGAINIVNRRADIQVTLPVKAACQVSARTRHGDIRSDFPLSITSSQGGKSASGTIGGGGPSLQIDSDNGDITISRGSAIAAPAPPTPPAPPAPPKPAAPPAKR